MIYMRLIEDIISIILLLIIPMSILELTGLYDYIFSLMIKRIKAGEMQ